MKNNIDYFIRYLDNGISNKERQEFEEKLEKDGELKSEFFKFIDTVNESKKEIEIDGRYFNSLLHEAKQRAKTKISKFSLKYAYVLPILIVGFVFLITNSNNSSLSSEYNFTALYESFAEDEEITVDLFIDALGLENHYYVDNEVITELYTNDISLDETVFEYLEENIAYNEISSNFVDELSDTEFDLLYEELIEKKY